LSHNSRMSRWQKKSMLKTLNRTFTVPPPSFQQNFEHFLPPEEEPIPDHLLMIFPASQHKEVLEICENYPNQLLDFGFFVEKPLKDKNFELICTKAEKYEQLPHNDNDKIIMKVAKRTSHLSLALMTMSPLHVSHNVAQGGMECRIFNEDFYASQDAVEESENEEDGSQ
jgi:hypothetical protein